MSNRPFNKLEARAVAAQMDARMLKAMVAFTKHTSSTVNGMSESGPDEMADVIRSAIPKLQEDLDMIKQCLAIWDEAYKSIPGDCTDDDIEWRWTP